MRLLLVEGNKGDGCLAQGLLRLAGIGAECYRASPTSPDDFMALADWADCVLVDLGPPGDQGLEGVRTVLGYTPWLPVVVFAGAAHRDLAEVAISEGAQDFLIKGHTDGEQLAKSIRYAIDRKKLERQLQQAQDLTRLGRLAGGFAHHFDNLHGAILSYTSLVDEALTDPAVGYSPSVKQAQLDLGEIRQAGERAAWLTRQLRIFAEQDLVTPQPVDLNELVTDACRALEPRAGNTVSIQLRLAPDLAPVLVHPGHVQQLIANVTDNAFEAMPSGGRLSIDTASTRQALPGPADRRYVRLRISDTGNGIPAGIHDRVFDPFFTTKPPGESMGLGLAVADGVMSRCGGRIYLEPRPGPGTAVTMLFPAASQPA